MEGGFGPPRNFGVAPRMAYRPRKAIIRPWDTRTRIWEWDVMWVSHLCGSGRYVCFVPARRGARSTVESIDIGLQLIAIFGVVTNYLYCLKVYAKTRIQKSFRVWSYANIRMRPIYSKALLHPARPPPSLTHISWIKGNPHTSQ